MYEGSKFLESLGLYLFDVLVDEPVIIDIKVGLVLITTVFKLTILAVVMAIDAVAESQLGIIFLYIEFG